MKINKYKKPIFLTFISLIVLLLFVYQNCAKKFVPAENAKLSSENVNAHISHNSTSPVDMGTPIEFNVSGDNIESTQMEWSYSLNGANSGCNDSGQVNGMTYLVSCQQAGTLDVYLTFSLNGEQSVARSRVIIQNPSEPTPTPTSTPSPSPSPTATPTPTPTPPNVVEFRIPMGTAQKPWNTRETAVRMKVGQTLRIVNDDNVAHRLHTNGQPFPHGTNIAPGASANYVIQQVYNSDTQGPPYDHIYQATNPRPNFWIFTTN